MWATGGENKSNEKLKKTSFVGNKIHTIDISYKQPTVTALWYTCAKFKT